MKSARQFFGEAVLVVTALAVAPIAVGQTPASPVRIISGPSGVTLSWTNRGTLQSAPMVGGPWKDLLGATNPLIRQPSLTAEYFRSIQRWRTRSNLLDANSEMAVAELDGKIYVMGGYPSSRVTQRTVQVYDVAENRWSRTTPLPIAVNHQMAVAVNRRIYVIGGQTDSGSTSFTNTVFEYDPVTTNWITRAPMPTARSAGAAAVVGSRIYVAGGRPPRGADFAVYDTVNNQWTTLPNLPTARNHIAACAIDGRIYVVGGRIEAGFTSPMINVLEVFDPTGGQWSTRAPMPTTRGGINGIAVNGCFFVWGGEGPTGAANPTGVFQQVEMYAPTLNRWFSLESLPVAVHGVTGAAYVNGWIHAPGGGTSTGGSSGSQIHQVFWVGPLTESLP